MSTRMWMLPVFLAAGLASCGGGEEESAETPSQPANRPPVILGQGPFSVPAGYDDGVVRIFTARQPAAIAVQADGRTLVVDSSGTLRRFNVGGTLDLTFGDRSDGAARLPELLDSVEAGRYSAASLLVQGDGRILVVGTIRDGTVPADGDFVLMRYNADGTLDTGFGAGDGIVTTDLKAGSDDEVGAATVQHDGKIVVVGSFGYGAPDGDGIDSNDPFAKDFAVVRYDADGTLDTAFGGGDGIVTTDLFTYPAPRTWVDTIGATHTDLGSHDMARSLQLQDDGRIIVAGGISVAAGEGEEAWSGTALVRYNPDGTLETSFGGLRYDGEIMPSPFQAGIVVQEYLSSVSIGLQHDGRILMAGGAIVVFDDGSSESLVALARFNAGGTLDNSFGDGGYAGLSADGRNFFYPSIHAQNDGQIALVVTERKEGRDHVGLYRFGADGSRAGENAMRRAEGPLRVARQPDGKFVVAGSTYINASHITVARYNPDLTLDASFSPGVREGEVVCFDIPFGWSDPDGHPTTAAATLADGSPLPAWLQGTGEGFCGVKPAGVQNLEIRITVTDIPSLSSLTGGLSTSATFSVTL